MYSKPRLALKYLHYYLSASNGRGHGVHSPFVYAFVRQVLKDKPEPDWFPRIEGMREKWKNNKAKIIVQDLGGKGNGSTEPKRVSTLAVRSLSSPKFGRFLFRLSGYCGTQRILELGTSLGISGSYLLAGAGPASRLVSIEGAETVAAMARETFSSLQLRNAEVRCGDFDRILPEVLDEGFAPDMVFIDGNHRRQPLLDYFNAVLNRSPVPAVIILHDIHWSREMEEGWQTICSLPQVTLSVDLFSAGLVFFNDRFLIKQHFRIRF